MVGRVGWGVLGVLVALTPGIGTAARAQSLDQGLEAAYWGNPTLRAQRSALAAIDHGVTQALSAWRPTVSTELGHVRSYLKGHDYDDNRGTMILPADQVSVTLSQRIADFGQTSGAVRAAEAQVLAGRATLADTEQTVLLDAAQAHVDVVRAQGELELARANVAVLERQWAGAQAGFDRQMNTQTDVAQARARLANAQATARQAEQTLETARGAYIAVIGQAPEWLRFPDTLPALPGRDSAQAQARIDNPKVRAAQYAIDAAEAAVDAAQASLRPTLSFQASDAYATHSSTSVDDQRTQTLGVVLRVPLYQSGAEYARIQARKQELGQRRQLLDAARAAARQTALAAWAALEGARARVASFQAAVDANETARQGVGAEHQRLGNRTLLDVLNAEQELFQARVNLLGAKRDEIAATFQVLAAMGRMTAEALNLAVVRYDPVPHYDRVRGTWIGWGDRDRSAGEDGPATP